ncbi:hypothetical protein ACFU5O_28275 [Streptomyces sp. NPDC057445]|uniref:hypothetical protein n=1 Tax=Streptomyces sp. NPDC057445 TaxID=3346136 RepID=UPI0036BA473B
MRLIEGTPQEIAEFLRLTAPEDDADAGAPVEAELDAPVSGLGGELDWAQITDLVRGRARSAEIAKRVLGFLEGAVALGNVEIGPGESERTRDGRTDYIMVRDAGVRRFGAVAYVKATNGGLTLRLTREDVADLDEPVSFRGVRAGHQYVVNCPLRDEEAVQAALRLVQVALTKVRR